MAGGYMAQMLDELMGRNRNLDPSEAKTDFSWDSPEVCKHFLCGFCPCELFINTRADLGQCNKIHDEDLKKQYSESTKFQKMGFEEDFERYLNTLVADVERRIRRGHQRLSLNNNAGTPGNPNPIAKDEKIKMLTERINDLVEQAENLGCEGKVEEAQGVLKLCEQLKEERTQLETSLKIAAENEKQMEVCDVCGALLIVGDVPQRVDEHLIGKQHAGYARIRAYLEEKKDKRKKVEVEREERLRKEREDREKEREKEREERRRKEKEREDSRRRRSRSRDRDRRRSRSRDRRRRSRSRDRHSRSRRSRSRERRRSSSRNRSRRSRSRSRGHKSSRHRSRSRERSRRNSRDKSREQERRSKEKTDEQKSEAPSEEKENGIGEKHPSTEEVREEEISPKKEMEVGNGDSIDSVGIESNEVPAGSKIPPPSLATEGTSMDSLGSEGDSETRT